MGSVKLSGSLLERKDAPQDESTRSALLTSDSTRVQRRILELLEEADSLSTGKIAWWIAGQAKPTPALAVSVRRALNGLQKNRRVIRVQGRGLEEKWRRWDEQRQRDEAIQRDTAERERIAQADAEQRERDEAIRRDTAERERMDAEMRAREDARRGAAVKWAPHRGTDIDSLTARLVKVLGLLASDHDGEVLSAARQADQIRRRLGRGWEELIIVPKPFGVVPAPFGTTAGPYDGGNQDEIDQTIDAFQQAMSAGIRGSRR